MILKNLTCFKIGIYFFSNIKYLEFMKKFLLVLFLLVFISFCGFSYYTYALFTTPSVKEDTFFIVKKGNSFRTIVINLIEQNLIPKNSKFIFKNVSRLIYKNQLTIKAGEYEFLKGTSPYDILIQLEEGDVYIRKITFAEGLTNDTILKMIDSTYGLFGDLPNEKIEEGTLLPETYTYTYGDSKSSIVKRMQKAMKDFLDKEWLKRSYDLPFETKEEAISLASIVEKETGIPEERGKVASVFVNRLRKGMRLQSDPTVIYSFTMGNKDLEREIRQSDLARISEYNTYRINGIPKKAIANPGRDAIKAVLNPENTNYLYFVATGDGGHNFSSTLDEHNTFVYQYRQKLKNKAQTENAKTN